MSGGSIIKNRVKGETNIIIGINSSVDETITYYQHGHAWISLYFVNSQKYHTFGGYPPAGDSINPDTDVVLDNEKGEKTSIKASRYKYINDKEYKKFMNFVVKPWKYNKSTLIPTNNCASWASDVWYVVTGEYLDADDWLHFETPHELGKSIKQAERKYSSKSIEPNIIKSLHYSTP
jgi:hypothetical protein